MSSSHEDLCTIPAAQSPDGQYDFDNPTSLAPLTISVNVTLITLSIILTVSRTFMNRTKLHSADYFTIIACVFNTAFTGDIVAQFRYNRHQWDVPVCWFTAAYFKLLFVQVLIFSPVFFFSKAAIFLLYKQLFGIQKRMRIAANIGLLLTLLLYLPNIPLSAIYHAPRVGATWESMLTSSGGHNMTIFGIFQSSLSVLLDLYIFVLPLPIIIKLQISRGRRLQLIGVFTTALMGIIASVLSLVYRVQLLETTDAMWRQAIVAMCALIETNVAIIVGCMPTLAQTLRSHLGFPNLLRSLRSRLLGVTGHTDSRPSDGVSNEEIPKLATIGSARPARRGEYYELTDTATLQTQVTAQNNTIEGSSLSPSGIIRSVAFSQQFRPERTKDLV
ncbi:hypothetical protein JX266_004542 [Neoarthrinium moseri]|nr:hypothetical protein JX266_004542 [Neoarthrinium moseri]